MPTLTVKQVIEAELLRVCLETTNKLREKDDKKGTKKKFDRNEVGEVERLLGRLTTECKTDMLKALAVLHRAPELEKGSALPLEISCVIVLEACHSPNHNYTLGKPYIVTNKDLGQVLNSNGVIGEYNIVSQAKPRYATEDEIQECIAYLTKEQWAVIHSNKIFQPIMDAAMNREIMVPETEGRNNGNSDNNEVQLADGRKITISTE